MKKRFLALLMAFIFAMSAAVPSNAATTKVTTIASDAEELHGIWVSVFDFAALGLNDKSESEFRRKTEKFMDLAEDQGINVVFFQVRAYDDAAWKSDTFPACSYLTSSASSSRTAYNTYSYDPLSIVIDAAHENDIELHAWMNPYRINTGQFLDPGLAGSQKRVKTAVNELLEYDIDGIHFDDYFYHATEGYVKPGNRNKSYAVNISYTEKCKNVNKLVKKVCKLCHKKDKVFGISPQGNVANDMNAGADVKTWLSKDGYVDYVAPQLYWSDSDSKSLYSERLKQFVKLHQNSARLYIGLALYKAGTSGALDDPGWGQSQKNLADQVKKLRDKDADGFILFSARYLDSSQTKKEVSNLEKIIEDD
ncbi:MAG: family 10 glycosylhydrolase [Lachnospiraceae bacterium]|nr:family 10 glycosylhydrolase [Lachnospiraceae bacterium]